MSDVKVIEATIEQVQDAIDLRDALVRLRANRDFKLIIQTGYIENEAIRLVALKADEEFQTPERQASILNQIDAIGALAVYLRTINTIGNFAEADLAQHKAELAYLEENPVAEGEDE